MRQAKMTGKTHQQSQACIGSTHPEQKAWAHTQSPGRRQRRLPPRPRAFFRAATWQNATHDHDQFEPKQIQRAHKLIKLHSTSLTMHTRVYHNNNKTKTWVFPLTSIGNQGCPCGSGSFSAVAGRGGVSLPPPPPPRVVVDARPKTTDWPNRVEEPIPEFGRKSAPFMIMCTQ